MLQLNNPLPPALNRRVELEHKRDRHDCICYLFYYRGQILDSCFPCLFLKSSAQCALGKKKICILKLLIAIFYVYQLGNICSLHSMDLLYLYPQFVSLFYQLLRDTFHNPLLWLFLYFFKFCHFLSYIFEAMLLRTYRFMIFISFWQTDILTL